MTTTLEPSAWTSAARSVPRVPIAFAVLLGLLAFGAFGSLAWGAADLSLVRVAQIVLHEVGLFDGTVNAWERTIVIQLRLPRLLMGLGVGAALGLSGAMMQGLFRNPLADPTLIGVSSGAALGATTTIVLVRRFGPELGGVSADLAVPVAAMLTGLVATAFVHRLSVRSGRTAVATMLLAGIAINALAFSGTGLWTYLADDAELRDITYWTLGSLAGASWGRLAWVAVLVAAGWILGGRAWAALDALLLGEAEAEHLGVEVERVRRRLVVSTAAMVGGAVAVCGQIAFVGLVVPHMIRLVVGPGHRVLLPASALLGGGILVGADLVARLSVAPSELPIGIVTAILGAPFFLLLLRRGS